MYYSHSLHDETFDFFISFLREAIAGKTNYIRLIEPVIRDTHSLVIGDKDIYSIDRSGFPVIVFLSKVEPDYFRKLNPENISTKDYNHILGIISSQRDTVFA